MILQWGTSGTVISRIYRNIKGIEAEYNDDILEWIPEALLKMKTKYSLEYKPYAIEVVQNQAKLPCKIEGLIGVSYKGRPMAYNDGHGTHKHHHNSAGVSLFQSLNPIYTSSGDISAGDEGRSHFPTDVIVMFDRDCWEEHWYKMNGRYLQTSVKEGWISVWVQDIPRDENYYPLIPTDEYVQEAIYRYCRMMLIEAGYEDKVFSHNTAAMAWEKAAGQAISAMTFPTPDQVEASIHRHLDNYFPDSYYFTDSWN